MDNNFSLHKQAVDKSTDMLAKYGKDNDVVIMGMITVCTKDGKQAFVKQFSTHPNLNI